LIKIIIQEENFKWHSEAFASELFIFFISDCYKNVKTVSTSITKKCL